MRRTYELEVLPGLERFAQAELSILKGARPDAEGLRFSFNGPMRAFRRLRSVVAVYRVEAFDVPRPKALLGHQQLTRLVALVREMTTEEEFTSFRFGAAGRESEVFERLAQELARETGLKHDPEEGELLMRFVRPEEGEGWEVLMRTSPRPLSARAWRVCNMAGGLNATLAHAMLRLGGVRPTDRVFNPMCGSGTLLVERAALGDPTALVGVDISEQALECARQNLHAAGVQDVELARVDVALDPLPARSFDLIVADLPWGDAIGTHEQNEVLYPKFLRAMGHAASRNGRMVVLTHEVRMFEELLEREGRWKIRDVIRVYHGGHHPRMYLLTK